MEMSTTMDNSRESDTTSMARMPLMHDQINQGMGRPMVMSKMLLPIDDETAELALPFLMFTTDVSMSGTEVPAARIVSPITVSGMLYASPNTVAHHTMKLLKMITHTMDMINVTM